MLTNNQSKLISGLKLKKNRYTSQLFVVEGLKSVIELLNSSFTIEHIYYTDNKFEPYIQTIKNITLITEKEMGKISQNTNPSGILAVAHFIKENKLEINNGLFLALDTINDPGNLGTIIRLADWFGIDGIICSPDTVDWYNPKVIQASMGSFSRIPFMYNELHSILSNTSLPIFGGSLSGQSIYTMELPKTGIIVMGNEANGISKSIEQLINHKLLIPSFGHQQTESLNVAMATSIILSEFKRTIV